jgi:hypothetical protein
MLRRVSRGSTLIGVVLALLPAMAAAQQAKPTLTGTWSFAVTSQAGTGTPTVTLKQQGDSLTGHYSSRTLGEAELAGIVKDQKFSFSIKADVQGQAVTVTYAGTPDGTDALKGTVDFGGMASGTFTAKRTTP